MKKKITCIVAMMMCIAVFCGCVKNDSNTEVSNSAQQEENNNVKDEDSIETIQNYENSYNEEFAFAELEEGNFGNYLIHKQTYNFNNDKSTSVKISYPSVEISNNKEISLKINEAIKKAAFYNYHEEEIADQYNIEIIEDYTIVYHSDDIISIFFTGEWIKGSFERGLSISLKDGSIVNMDSLGIGKEKLLKLLKTSKVCFNRGGLIDYLRDNNEDIAEYFYDIYLNYNDEKYNLFVDDKNIYIVSTVAPVYGYDVTLKISYDREG